MQRGVACAMAFALLMLSLLDCACLQAREAGRLLQDKQALESRLKEMERILATVQDQRNELKQQYKVRCIMLMYLKCNSPLACCKMPLGREKGF